MRFEFVFTYNSKCFITEPVGGGVISDKAIR